MIWFSFLFFCLSIGLHDSTSASTDCPAGCKCEILDGDYIAASCLTKHPQVTINLLPNQTSHLQMFFTPDVEFYAIIMFSNLPELRFLLLDTQQKFTKGHKVDILKATFENNPHLEVFRSRVRLHWQGHDIFSRMPNLTEIHLSKTVGGWNDLKLITNQSLSDKRKLTKLYLSALCEPGRSEWSVRGTFRVLQIFGEMRASKIRELDISSNELHYIYPQWSGSFRYLEYLDISYNMLCFPTHKIQEIGFSLIGVTIALRELKTFKFGHQGVSSPDQTKSQNKYDGSSVNNSVKLPTPSTDHPNRIVDAKYKFEEALTNHRNEMADSNHEFGAASTNHKDTIVDSECGVFSLPIGNIRALIAPAIIPPNFPLFTTYNQGNQKCYKFTKPNNLEYLDLQDNAIFFYCTFNGVDDFVPLNLDKLRTINLQRASVQALPMSLPRHLPSLEVALLGGNKLGKAIQNNSFPTNFSELRVLDLAENDIAFFPADFFKDMLKLTHLNISANGILTLDANLTLLSNLVLLNVSFNRFANLSESFRSQLEFLSGGWPNESTSRPQGHLVVDLQGNPFSCLCNDIDSVKWTQNTKVTLYAKETYTCIHPVDGQVNLMKADIEKLKKYCFPDLSHIYIISAVTSSLVTLVIVLIVTLYCKRWHVRYWLYLLRMGWKKYNQEHDETEYEFDVFVAHSREDEDWVTGPLFDELEVKRGIRLCLYQRDILPNEILVEAIVDRIDKSRHTLLVLSPNFVESNWCHFEMHIAHAKWSEEGKDMIFPVILKPLSSFSVNRTLHYLLKRKVYLEWPSDPFRQQLFWQRLATSLGPSGQTAPSNDDNWPMNNEDVGSEQEYLPLLQNRPPRC